MLTKQCNMQQLSLQFEGYADEMRQPVEVSATTQRNKVSDSSHAGNNPFPRWEKSVPTLGTSCKRLKACELSVGWALKQVNPSASLSRVVARVKLLAQGAFLVVFGFGMMFLAAIIGG